MLRKVIAVCLFLSGFVYAERNEPKHTQVNPPKAARPRHQAGIAVTSDLKNPSLVFAMEDLKKALRGRGHAVTLMPLSDLSEYTGMGH